MGKQKTASPDLSSIIFLVILLAGTIILAVPFIWMMLTSLKTYSESTSINPFVIFPEKPSLTAYSLVIRNNNFGRLYYNTIAMIAGRIFFAILSGSMAGYALGRLNFFGKSLCFSIILVQMMVPVQIFIIPQYLMIIKLDATNTIFGLLFPGLVTAFGAFLLRQHFKALPSSVEESAKIDGANPFQIYLFVMMPMVRSGMVALGIFTALFAYKELMWPLIVNPATNAMTLSAALAKLQGQAITYYPQLMAAATLASIPIIIIYLFFQKQFIHGIATTGQKL